MNSHPIKILKIWIPLATILVLILPFVACGSLKNKGYSIEVELPLAETLYETSGLYCPSDKSFFTINDSGNAPLIYELDINGEIVEEHKIESRNIDWEAISGDDEYFYIGDIGNNNGKRKHVNIIQVSKENFNIRNIKVKYENNDIESNQYIKHNFDAEALVSVNSQLYLFSKSWQSGNLQVYLINSALDEQQLSPINVVLGLPGVVTGVDYHEKMAEFIIVGYKMSTLGVFSPYIARLDTKFNIVNIYPLTEYNQVEGICINPSGEMWFSQEKSFFSGAKLVKFSF